MLKLWRDETMVCWSPVGALASVGDFFRINGPQANYCDEGQSVWYDVDMEPTIQKTHIEVRNGVCGGKPCIKGTRVRVWDIHVLHDLNGRSPEEILNSLLGITLADIYAALAFYWDNQEAIDRQMAQADAVVDSIRVLTGSGPLEQKLGGGDACGNPISS